MVDLGVSYNDFIQHFKNTINNTFKNVVIHESTDFTSPHEDTLYIVEIGVGSNKFNYTITGGILYHIYQGILYFSYSYGFWCESNEEVELEYIVEDIKYQLLKEFVLK